MSEDVKIKQDKNGNNLVVLKGVYLCWPFLGSKTNEMSDKYQVDVSNLSKSQAKALSDLGLDIRKEDKDKLAEREQEGLTTYNRGMYVTAKSNKQYYKIIWPNKQELTEEEIDAIGNGTLVNITLKTYSWEFKGKKGTSAGPSAIVIRDMVRYEPGVNYDDDLFDGVEQEESKSDDLDDPVEDLF